MRILRVRLALGELWQKLDICTAIGERLFAPASSLREPVISPPEMNIRMAGERAGGKIGSKLTRATTAPKTRQNGKESAECAF
jgi:hypothetical protein